MVAAGHGGDSTRPPVQAVPGPLFSAVSLGVHTQLRFSAR